MYILLSGAPPFDGEDDNEILDAIRVGKFTMEGKIWKSISPDAKDLIKKMLTNDYKKRPFAKEVLQHPWFASAPQKPIEPELLKGCLGQMR